MPMLPPLSNEPGLPQGMPAQPPMAMPPAPPATDPASDPSMAMGGGDPMAQDPETTMVDPMEAMQRLMELKNQVGGLKNQGDRARGTFSGSIKDDKLNRVVRINLFFRHLKELGYDISDPNDVTRLIADLETNQPGSSSILSQYLDALDPDKTQIPPMTQAM